MRYRFSLDNPDDMRATLTITLTIKDWKAVAEEMGTTHPAWKVTAAIREMITRAETKFFGEHEASL